MSEGDGVKPIRLADVASEHGPIVFQVRLFADGHLDWRTPNGVDPAMNEILLRGYFDKVRETILSYLTRGQIIT